MKAKSYIEKYPKRIIEVAEIIRNSGDNYEADALDVRKLVEEGVLIPVKASGLNGRSPVLYYKYKIIRQEKDFTEASGKIRLLHARFDQGKRLLEEQSVFMDIFDLILNIESSSKRK